MTRFLENIFRKLTHFLVFGCNLENKVKNIFSNVWYKPPPSIYLSANQVKNGIRLTIREMGKEGRVQKRLGRWAKVRLRSTYPKKLNSEARLWDGKVLSTHSVQTESSIIDYCDQCTPFLCMR